MIIKITRLSGATVVVLNGPINAKTVDLLSETVLPLILPQAKVILDATAVEFLSSAGLRLLLQLERASVSTPCVFVLTGLSDDVKETMLITGFLPHFTCFPTTTEALAA
jgi:anti-sigma B factor antagonist